MPVKSKKSEKKNTKNRVVQSSDSPKKSWLKWCVITTFKLALVTFCSLAIYAIYLDSKVQRTFEGQRWQIPIQVYGKVPTIFLGAPLNLKHLSETLALTGYKKVNQLTQAGQFSLSSHRINIALRAFDYGQGLVEAQTVSITVKDQTVQKIMVEKQPVAEVKLEPVLIDRILPESKEDRVIVGLEQVPEQLLDTLLLVEDRDFYFHSGISPLGILRALISNIKAGRTVQGGSTLTQQLVKNMFLTRQKTLWRKMNEAIIALILEYRYSKDQLLEAYVNEVYLGQHYANGIYGFGLAAEFYFGKNINELTVEQMATLIGQIKGPSYYDPWRYPKRALERRDLILTLMFEHELLSKHGFTQAIESPLSVRTSRRLTKQKQPTYLQVVKRELSDILSQEVQQSGVRVFTGFDVRAQQKLNDIVIKTLPELEQQKKQKNIEVAMMVTDHYSGEIVALAGGRNPQYAGFNRVLNASRPIGSLVKPAIYLAALEGSKQYHLGSVLDDKPLAIESDNGEVWRPNNYDGEFRGQASLFNGLVKSLNVPTVNLGLEIGLSSIADVLHTLGYRKDIYPQPSMLLGSINMSPYEINQLYLAIASQGYRRESHVINQVMTSDGHLLWQFENSTEQILSSQSAYLLGYALHEVTKQGTAKSLSWRLPKHYVAGKTGTSNDQRDSWFIGYDDQYLVTTWLGKDNNEMTAFTGSSGALVLYAKYMQQLGVNDLNLAEPANIADVWFDDISGKAYKNRCANSTAYPTNLQVLSQQAECTKKHDKDKTWFDRWFGD